MLGCREESLDTVVVFLPDGIKFMIVAARTTESYAQKRRPDYIRHLRQDFIAYISFVLITSVLAVRAKPVETAGDEHFVARGINLVTCELLLHKLVIRLVLLKGSDCIVAILPCVRSVRVVFKPVALGEAHYVKPMLRPSLAIFWRCEKPIDELGPCLRRRILHKRGNLLWSWRQPYDIQVDSTNQRLAVRFGSMREVFFLEPRKNERINRRSCPGAIFSGLELRNLGRGSGRKDQ